MEKSTHVRTTSVHHSEAGFNTGSSTFENSSSSEDDTNSTTGKPRRMRLLSDVYNEAPECELFDDELLMLSID